MSEFEQRESGLVVPKAKQKPPKRKYGPLEIQDEERRELAAEALSQLWDAMELSSGHGLLTPETAAREAWMQAWEFVGNMVLGRDCPSREVLT